MATKIWEPLKVDYCPRINEEIALEVLLVYPSEFLSEQNPRVLAHRCSAGLMCNTLDKPGCVWAGTNPTYNPFAENIVRH